MEEEESVYVGNALSAETKATTAFTLNSTHNIATLDYGLERAGFPFFDVASVSNSNSNSSQPHVQIEVKYSEPFAGLNQSHSDGPYTFATGLSNAFRVETFNLTTSVPGRLTAPLLQGGQRWQSIRLLSPTEGDSSSVSFDRVGFVATVDNDIGSQGAFECDDDELNAIWRLGAVAAATACVEEGSQPAVWEIDGEMGAYVRSLRPAQSLAGAGFGNYSLGFDTYIDRGGVWWSVAWPLGRLGGFQLMLVSELPEESTFVNVNRTLTPPNSILLSYGYGFVNQTTLTSYNLDKFTVPFPVAEKTWHHITTILSPEGYLAVSLDNQAIFNVSISDYYTGEDTTASLTGTFGFGGWQDQASYIRNVTVTDTLNGTTLYQNPMTAPSVLAEYGVQSNQAPVCLDGPKRDRLVWLGDFYHTARILGASSARHFDLSRGTLQFLLDTQLADGELSISPPMGYDAATATTPFAGPEGVYGLSDYQMLGLGALYSYVRVSGDLEFVRGTWDGWARLGSWLVGSVDVADGLVRVPSAFLGPGGGGSAVSCAAVQALREMAEIAQALGFEGAQENYTSVADSLQTAINTRLWNDELGVYSASLDNTTDFSVAGIAFCITAGVATPNKTTRSLTALQQHLLLPPGYKDSTAATSSNPYISPNTNGFLLDALFRSHAWETGHALLRSLWGAMVRNPLTASGASWEYVGQDGEPGLGLFTSLAHPWGGAATYVLTEWAAGLRAAPGVAGFGYKEWVVEPGAGVDVMGLRRAAARVVTGLGVVAVNWTVVGGDLDGGSLLRVDIAAPVGTRGRFLFRGEERVLSGDGGYVFTVEL